MGTDRRALQNAPAGSRMAARKLAANGHGRRCGFQPTIIPPCSGFVLSASLQVGPKISEGYTAMLVLSRKKNESIVINNDILITVVEIRGDKVRLGIVAPKDVPVHRQEVYEAIHGHRPDVAA